MVGRTNNHAGNQGDEERPSSNETMPYFLTHLLMVGTKKNIFLLLHFYLAILVDLCVSPPIVIFRGL